MTPGLPLRPPSRVAASALLLLPVLAACGGGHERAATTTATTTTAAAVPAPAVPAAVSRAPLRRRGAHLFLLGLGGADPERARTVGGRGWGGVVAGRSDAASPGALKPAAGDL